MCRHRKSRKFVDDATGSILLREAGDMTHLHGNVLVPKDNKTNCIPGKTGQPGGSVRAESDTD